MEDVLNQEIVVLDYKIAPSTKREGTEYLTLQIEFEGQKRVIFTGGKRLIEIVKAVPDGSFPFKTTIKKEYKSFLFT